MACVYGTPSIYEKNSLEELQWTKILAHLEPAWITYQQ